MILIDIGYVYKITSPSGKIYIGSTINVQKRFKNYNSLSCPKQIKLYRSLLKYGVDNHIFEIIWEGAIDEMLFMECELGHKYKVLTREFGLNSRLPNKNDIYKSYSEEYIEKMVATIKNKYKNGYKSKVSKKIEVTNLITSEVKIFETIDLAVSYSNISKWSIYKNCKGRRKIKNFTFKYIK